MAGPAPLEHLPFEFARRIFKYKHIGGPADPSLFKLIIRRNMRGAVLQKLIDEFGEGFVYESNELMIELINDAVGVYVSFSSDLAVQRLFAIDQQLGNPALPDDNRTALLNEIYSNISAYSEAGNRMNQDIMDLMGDLVGGEGDNNDDEDDNNNDDNNNAAELEAADVAAAAAYIDERINVHLPLSAARDDFTYNGPPIVRDIINMEDRVLTDIINDQDIIIFKAGPVFFMYTKDALRALIADRRNIVFQCDEQLEDAPLRGQVLEAVPYFNLAGNINYTVMMGQIQTILNDPVHHTFELVQTPGIGIAHSASYHAVVVHAPTGHGYEGPVNLFGLDHCTAGTNKTVYTIHPVRLVAAVAMAGGKRRRRSMKRVRRRSMRRRRHSRRL